MINKKNHKTLKNKAKQTKKTKAKIKLRKNLERSSFPCRSQVGINQLYLLLDPEIPVKCYPEYIEEILQALE